MKINANIEYATRAAMELAARYPCGKAVPVEEIADAQRIPKKFLLHILLRLNQAGIVRSVRGTGGGYLLSRHPSQVTLLEVVRGIDRCIADDSKRAPAGNASAICELLDDVWADANRRMAEALNMSLENLLLRVENVPITYEI